MLECILIEGLPYLQILIVDLRTIRGFCYLSELSVKSKVVDRADLQHSLFAPGQEPMGRSLEVQASKDARRRPHVCLWVMARLTYHRP